MTHLLNAEWVRWGVCKYHKTKWFTCKLDDAEMPELPFSIADFTEVDGNTPQRRISIENLAEVLLDLHADRIRFSDGEWHHWNLDRWQADGGRVAFCLARSIGVAALKGDLPPDVPDFALAAGILAAAEKIWNSDTGTGDK